MVPAVYRCFAKFNFSLSRSGRAKHGEVNLKSADDISGFDTLRMNPHHSFEPDVLFFLFSFFVWPLSSPKSSDVNQGKKYQIYSLKILSTDKQHQLQEHEQSKYLRQGYLQL